jgi:hypothetical protein
MEEWKNGRVEGWKPSIKHLMVIIDLEGCSPLQQREPTKTPTIGTCLARQTKLSSPSAAPGTGRLQVPIKDWVAAIDLDGCSPLQPRERNIVPSGFGSAEGPGALYVPIKV